MNNQSDDKNLLLKTAIFFSENNEVTNLENEKRKTENETKKPLEN